jgi:hypothetical protein
MVWSRRHRILLKTGEAVDEGDELAKALKEVRELGIMWYSC